MEICVVERCTGCLACYNACGSNAIEIVRDDEGFDRPVVNEDKCVSCGKCVRSCPVNNPVRVDDYEKSVYACWLKDKEARKTSTSGGAFSAIAEVILNQNGVVYGAFFGRITYSASYCYKQPERFAETQRFKICAKQNWRSI